MADKQTVSEQDVAWRGVPPLEEAAGFLRQHNEAVALLAECGQVLGELSRRIVALLDAVAAGKEGGAK